MKKRKKTSCTNAKSFEEIKIYDKQLNEFIKKIEIIHDSQNKKIEATLVRINNENKKNEEVNDGFSKFVRWLLTILFCGFGIFMILGTINSIKTLWNGNFINDLAVIILFIISICSIVLGISIHKIKNRNYLISVFSALVAFTALIVALIK